MSGTEVLLTVHNLQNFKKILFTKKELSLMAKCSYCGHGECDKCRAEAARSSSKAGYCCQCHRTGVMK